jgi:hypothetical protein
MPVKQMPLPVLTENETGAGEKTTFSHFQRNLWRNTSFSEIKKHLRALENGHKTPVMGLILGQMLLTAAAAPAGVDGHKPLFFDRRLRTLYAFGQIEALDKLLTQVPPERRTVRQRKFAIEALLWRGRAADACAYTVVAASPSLYGQKLLLLCQMRNKDYEKADLTLSLLREKSGNNPMFKIIEEFLYAREVKNKADVSPRSVLDLALLAAVRYPYPLPVNLTGSPLLWAKLARMPAQPASVRRRAAELAVLWRLLPPDVLRELYAALPWYQRLQLTPAGQLPGVLADIPLHDKRLLAVLLPGLMRELPAQARFGDCAEKFVPLLLLAGQREEAEKWLEVLAQRADAQDAVAQASLQSLWPLLVLHAPYPPVGGWDRAQFTTWAENINAKADKMLFTYLQLGGYPIPPRQVVPLMPAPDRKSLFYLIRQARDAEAIGLGVLLALRLLAQDRTPDTYEMLAAANALHELGLLSYWRQLTMETSSGW